MWNNSLDAVTRWTEGLNIKWIRIEDKLPKENTPILAGVYFKKYSNVTCISASIRIDEKWFDYDLGKRRYVNVWMPLPNKPED